MTTRTYSENLAGAASQKVKEGEYWLNKLSGEPVKSCFPYDFNQAAPRTPRPVGRIFPFQLPAAVGDKLMQVSNRSDVRLHIVLVTGIVLLLHKYTENRDIIVGTPIYKQEVEGEFINTVLALRSRLEETMTFKDLLLQVGQTLLEAVENQNYPIETLLYQLGKTVDADDFPLFDVAVLLENVQDRHYINHIHANVVFSFKRKGTAIGGTLEYNPCLYRPVTAEALVSHLRLLLLHAVNDVSAPLGTIEILSPAMKRQVLYDFNLTRTADSPQESVEVLWERRARRTPGRMAVVHGDIQVSYALLNGRAGRLARYLHSRGVGPGVLLAVLLEGSVELPVALLGILKAGGAYVPMDSNAPAARLTNQIRELEIEIVLTVQSLAPKIAPGRCRCLQLDLDWPLVSRACSAPRPQPVGTGALIYAIYTSGSTGRPKGAGVTRRGFANLMHWFVREFKLGCRDRVLLVTSLSFDLTQKNIFAPLLIGGSLHLLTLCYFDPGAILREIARKQVTWLNCTPGMFSQLIEDCPPADLEQLTSLHSLFLGGEPIVPSRLLKWVESGACNARIVNTYGPTECTDICAFHRLGQPELYTGEAIPVGRPVTNAQLYVLDRQQRPAAVGMPGELCIGGEGVGVGYLNDPQLTAGKFLSLSPDAGAPRLVYRTGDLVKWLPQGEIEFLGRIDFQVKIRGFRVELGEIENQLLKHRQVNEAVAMVREDQSLCAYIVCPEAPNVFELKEYLARLLPDYMIPAHFFLLEKFPLTPHGKVDRKALLSLGTPLGTGVDYIPPRTEVDKKIAGVWREVLKVKKVGICENFFDIGGDSLLIIRLNSSLKKVFNRDISIANMFRYPTIRSMAQYLAGAGGGDDFVSGPRLEAVQPKGSAEMSRIKERLGQRIQRRRGDMYHE
jgi:amino acid adenylation domain-containing protein